MAEAVNQLEIAGLACERQERVLFRDLSFQLDAGQMARIHGRNGSGKSSLLKIITGLLESLSGHVYWNRTGIDEHPARFHRQLTYLGHKPAIKPELTVIENLKVLLRLRGQACTPTVYRPVLENLSLGEYENIQAGYLSAGQQRRIALARLWLENTRLWVLDEPYTSLDQHAVVLVNLCIESALSRGVIIVMTSHQDTSGLDVHPVDIYLEDRC